MRRYFHNCSHLRQAPDLHCFIQHPPNYLHLVGLDRKELQQFLCGSDPVRRRPWILRSSRYLKCRRHVLCQSMILSLDLFEILTVKKVHQRGKRIAFVNIMSLGPINLGPILSGYVADRYTWRTNFWILSAFTAMNLILVILFAPETQYERPAAYDTDLATTQLSQVESMTQPNEKGGESGHREIETAIETAEFPEIEEPLSYWQELKPYSGLHGREKVWKYVAQLCRCGMYPAVIWGSLVGGTYSAWVLFLSFERYAL